jgi:hypothetical protein
MPLPEKSIPHALKKKIKKEDQERKKSQKINTEDQERSSRKETGNTHQITKYSCKGHSYNSFSARLLWK